MKKKRFVNKLKHSRTVQTVATTLNISKLSFPRDFYFHQTAACVYTQQNPYANSQTMKSPFLLFHG